MHTPVDPAKAFVGIYVTDNLLYGCRKKKYIHIIIQVQKRHSRTSLGKALLGRAKYQKQSTFLLI